jgi:hypothetical protein
MDLKDKLIYRYIQLPSALTEVLASLDERKGWDAREVDCDLYIENMKAAKESGEQIQIDEADRDFGQWIRRMFEKAAWDAIKDDYEGVVE